MVRWLYDALFLTWKGHLWIHKCTNALLPNYPWKGNIKNLSIIIWFQTRGTSWVCVVDLLGENGGLPKISAYNPQPITALLDLKSAYRQIMADRHNQQWDPGAIHSQHGSRRSQNPSVWLDCLPAVARHWRSLPNLGGRDDLGEPPVLIWWETNGKMTTAYNGINYLQRFK